MVSVSELPVDDDDDSLWSSNSSSPVGVINRDPCRDELGAIMRPDAAFDESNTAKQFNPFDGAPKAAETAESKKYPMERVNYASRSGDDEFDPFEDVYDMRDPEIDLQPDADKLRSQFYNHSDACFVAGFEGVASVSDVRLALSDKRVVCFRPTADDPEPWNFFVNASLDDYLAADKKDDIEEKLACLFKHGQALRMDTLLNTRVLTASLRVPADFEPNLVNMEERQCLFFASELRLAGRTGYTAATIDASLSTLNVSPFVQRDLVVTASKCERDEGIVVEDAFHATLNQALLPFEYDKLKALFDDVLSGCRFTSSFLAASQIMSGSNAIVMLPHRLVEIKETIRAQQLVEHTIDYFEQRYATKMHIHTVLSIMLLKTTRTRGVDSCSWGALVPKLPEHTDPSRTDRAIVLGACGSAKTREMERLIYSRIIAYLEACVMAVSSGVVPNRVCFVVLGPHIAFTTSLQADAFKIADKAFTEFFAPWDGIDVQSFPGGRSRHEWIKFKYECRVRQFFYKSVKSLTDPNVSRKVRESGIRRMDEAHISIYASTAHSGPKIVDVIQNILGQPTSITIIRDEYALALGRMLTPGKMPYATDFITEHALYGDRRDDCPALVDLDLMGDAGFHFMDAENETFPSISVEMSGPNVPIHIVVGLAVGPRLTKDLVTGVVGYPRFMFLTSPGIDASYLKAARTVMSLTRPFIVGEDVDDGLLGVDGSHPGIAPMPSSWLCFEPTVNTTLGSYARGRVCRAELLQSNIAVGTVSSSLSIPLCSASSLKLPQEHAHAAAALTRLVSTVSSRVLDNDYAAELLATPVLGVGFNFIIKEFDPIHKTGKQLRMFSTSFPSHAGPVGDMQAARRGRNNNVSCGTASEFQQKTVDEPLPTVEAYLLNRSRSKLNGAPMPSSAAEVAAAVGTSNAISVAQRAGNLLQSVKRNDAIKLLPYGANKALGKRGLAKVMMRLERFSGDTLMRHVIAQMKILTAFIPSRCASGPDWIASVCGFTSVAGRKFLDAARGVDLMVQRVAMSIPNFPLKFLCDYAPVCNSLQHDNTDSLLVDSMERANASLQAMLTYRTHASADQETTFADASAFATKLIEPYFQMQPEGPVGETAEAKAIRAECHRVMQVAVYTRQRLCKTGRDMTLMAMLYREIDLQPRDRVLCALACQLIALRHSVFMLQTEQEKSSPGNDVSSANVLAGIAAFIAVMSHSIHDYGEVTGASSIREAIANYKNNNNVIPCNIAVFVDGAWINLMEHTANLFAAKPSMAQRLRKCMVRVTNITVSAPGRGGFSYGFGGVFPPDTMDAEKARQFASNVDNLPTPRRMRLTNEEQLIKDNMSNMTEDELGCKVMPEAEPMTTATLLGEMQRHSPDNIKFVLGSGGSLVKLVDEEGERLTDDEVAHNLLVEMDKQYTLLGAVMDRFTDRPDAVVELRTPAEVAAAKAANEAEVRQSNVQQMIRIQYTAADARYAKMRESIAADGAVRPEAVQRVERSVQDLSPEEQALFYQRQVRAQRDRTAVNKRKASPSPIPHAKKRPRLTGVRISEMSTSESSADSMTSLRPRTPTQSEIAEDDVALGLRRAFGKTGAARSRGRPAKATEVVLRAQEQEATATQKRADDARAQSTQQRTKRARRAGAGAGGGVPPPPP
jgi:hypothetical protein